MKKETFVTKEQLDAIVKEYPTPFHLYDEKGIRANAQAVKDAFAWNKGYKEFFAVKATPSALEDSDTEAFITSLLDESTSIRMLKTNELKRNKLMQLAHKR